MLKRIAFFVSLLVLALPFAAQRAITTDTHADTPTESMKQPFDLGAWNKRGMFDYPRMKAGGLDAEFFAAYVPANYANNGAAAYRVKIMETIHETVDAYPQWVRFAQSTEDIRHIVAGGHRATARLRSGQHPQDHGRKLHARFRRGGEGVARDAKGGGRKCCEVAFGFLRP